MCEYVSYFSASFEKQLRETISTKSRTDILRSVLAPLKSSLLLQVNIEAGELLYNAIKETAELSPYSTLLDVCCGTGAVSLPLAGSVRGVVGVERVTAAVEDANYNAQQNGISNASFVPGVVQKVLPLLTPELRDCADVVAVVNPGRSGLSNGVITCLRENPAISKLLYISCNPGGRALENFTRLGDVKSKHLKHMPPMLPRYAFSVDMFPLTSHFEMAMLSSRSIHTIFPPVGKLRNLKNSSFAASFRSYCSWEQNFSSEASPPVDVRKGITNLREDMLKFLSRVGDHNRLDTRYMPIVRKKKTQSGYTDRAFVDHLMLRTHGGDGGNGAISLASVYKNEFAGTDGGDGDMFQLAVADIPGLVEDAHKNRGLGYAFLRHVQRCAGLLYVLDGAQPEPWKQLEVLKRELDLYDKGLSQRPYAVVANKIDLPEAKENLEELKARVDLPVVGISAKHGDSVKELMSLLRWLTERNSSTIHKHDTWSEE
ncbi:GTP binding domain [Trinorchestia longiramus]|nr:GTP binding domain [Trinorchestia longiramus]